MLSLETQDPMTCEVIKMYYLDFMIKMYYYLVCGVLLFDEENANEQQVFELKCEGKIQY